MNDLIRMSHVALRVIPEEHRFELHRMYEDTDVDGAWKAEALVDFLIQETPGLYVGFLANDSVDPPCAFAEGHYPCDYYDPNWSTVLVKAEIWEQYKETVYAKDQEWKDAHGCMVEK